MLLRKFTNTDYCIFDSLADLLAQKYLPFLYIIHQKGYKFNPYIQKLFEKQQKNLIDSMIGEFLMVNGHEQMIRQIFRN